MRCDEAGCQTMKSAKEILELRWLKHGELDLFASWKLDEACLGLQRLYLLHQGIEKMGKGMMICLNDPKLPPIKTEDDFDAVDTYFKKYWHCLDKIVGHVDELSNKGMETLLQERQVPEADNGMSEWEFLELMCHKGLTEAKYPVSEPTHRSFPLIDKNGKKCGYLDLITSHVPETICRRICQQFFEIIKDKNDCLFRELNRCPSSDVEEDEWQRFLNEYVRED